MKSMSKTCGIVLSDGMSATFLHPVENYDRIDWNKVSESFKKEFMDVWNAAYENDHDDGYSILDEIGWMINEGMVSSSDTLWDTWDRVLDEFCKEGVSRRNPVEDFGCMRGVPYKPRQDEIEGPF